MASQWQVRTRIDYKAINSVRGEEGGMEIGKEKREGGSEERKDREGDGGI